MWINSIWDTHEDENNRVISVSKMNAEDVQLIYEAFKSQWWDKPIETLQKYYKEQLSWERDVLVARVDNEVAWYITVTRTSEDDEYFQKNNIPEIKDFNTFIKFRGKGIGYKLMDEIESMISWKSQYVWLSVWLTEDYGVAQQMYVKRWYIPTWRWLLYKWKPLKYWDTTVLDDDLCLSFTKKLY